MRSYQNKKYKSEGLDKQKEDTKYSRGERDGGYFRHRF
jgi:hypothetical protein